MNATRRPQRGHLLWGIALVAVAIACFLHTRARHESARRAEQVDDSKVPASGDHRMTPGAEQQPRASIAVAPRADATKPWWATLSREEIEARRDDFEHLRQAPGAWPEFGEIHRQLMDNGVPRDIQEMECREIYGALLDRMQAEEAESEYSGSLPSGTDPEQADNYRIFAEKFRNDRLKALAEVHERLASVGIPTDSEAAERILQLRPHNPLRRLATDPPPAPLPANLPSSAEVFAAASAAVRAQVEAAIRDGRLPPPTPPEPPTATTDPTKR